VLKRRLLLKERKELEGNWRKVFRNRGGREKRSPLTLREKNRREEVPGTLKKKKTETKRIRVTLDLLRPEGKGRRINRYLSGRGGAREG